MSREWFALTHLYFQVPSSRAAVWRTIVGDHQSRGKILDEFSCRGDGFLASGCMACVRNLPRIQDSAKKPYLWMLATVDTRRRPRTSPSSESSAMGYMRCKLLQQQPCCEAGLRCLRMQQRHGVGSHGRRFEPQKCFCDTLGLAAAARNA